MGDVQRLCRTLDTEREEGAMVWARYADMSTLTIAPSLNVAPHAVCRRGLYRGIAALPEP